MFSLISSNAFAADPEISAQSRELVSSYSWGYKSGAKQHIGSYKNGRSLHAISRRSGAAGIDGNPDNLLWVDEHSGQVAALEHPAGYFDVGENPATCAAFTSDAPSGEVGRIWWVLGGRAADQPFDMVRSSALFNPFAFETKLNDFVTESQSTTPNISVVGQTALVVYRRLNSRALNGEVRFQDYDLLPSGTPALKIEKALARAGTVAGLGNVTIEQLWSRWDPKRRALAVTWQWFARPNGTANSNIFGSNPYIFTEDFGETWRSADGAEVALPLTYATRTPTTMPYDHIAQRQNTAWLPRDLGFSPSGVPWILLPSGPTSPSSNGWQMTFFRWSQSAWQGAPISSNLQGSTDPVACGTTRDYLICAYSDLAKPGVLLVRTSRDNGATWSSPVPVETIGKATNGSVQYINWVSFAQPADRYLDNAARFFFGYYRASDSGGKFYKNNLRWIRVQVGPRADFNADKVTDDADTASFLVAHAGGDPLADFNDDGSVDSADINEFNEAVEQDQSGGDPPDPGDGEPGTYQQASDGLVSIEGEHFEPQPVGWNMANLAEASGQQGIKALGGPATPASDLGARTEYRVNFTRTGSHFIWLRMRGPGASSNALRVGLDGGTPLLRVTTADGTWLWRMVATPVNVATIGEHVIRIYRNEADVELDKIVITPGGFTPSGLGPPESPRN